MSDLSDATRRYMQSLRNIGIIAHIDAGKTTLSERILYYTGQIHRMGEVHEGAATMDFLPEEQERGITVAAACWPCPWREHVIQLIDTPGHVDFSIEVERCLRVVDGAVGIFCAVGGVEAQSETVWGQSEHFHIPKLVFINKIDRPGASFARVFGELRSRLGANPVPVVMPVQEGLVCHSVIDLVREERVTFEADSLGAMCRREPLTEAEYEMAKPWRAQLLEALCDEDDTLLEAYLTGTPIAIEAIRTVLRNGVLRRSVVPVFCGSALHNVGIQLLLDGICDYLPSPLEVDPQQVVPVNHAEGSVSPPVVPDPAGPFMALVFKILVESGHKTAWVRVYSGRLKEGMSCLNVTQNTIEKIGGLLRLEAEGTERILEAVPGDIVAVKGLRAAVTGDTLGQKDAPPWLLENIQYYQPVISLALEPRNSGDGARLDEACSRYTQEDPTLRYVRDESLGERVVSGMGELHLDIFLERLRREYQLDIRVGQPQVLCRETVGETATSVAHFNKILGGIAQVGAVSIRVAPRKRGDGNVISWTFSRTSIASAWGDEIDRALESGFYAGPLQGFPLQDVQCEVLAAGDGEAVCTPAGCHMAAVEALHSALIKAGPVLLEPVMRVDISVPEDQFGAALNSLNVRSGKVLSVLAQAQRKLIEGEAPMRGLFGFATSLRSATQGKAGLQIRFSRFDCMEPTHAAS